MKEFGKLVMVVVVISSVLFLIGWSIYQLTIDGSVWWVGFPCFIAGFITRRFLWPKIRVAIQRQKKEKIEPRDGGSGG